MNIDSSPSLSSSRGGQTIIEAMVALGVLIIGLMGVLTLLSRSLLLQRVTSDQAKATYLASEGIEVAKSLIDHEAYLSISSKGADGGWGTCLPSGDYDLDYATMRCLSVPNYGGEPLYFDSETGLYYSSTDPGMPSGASATNFVRKVTITNNGNEIDVKSTVTWSTGVIIGQSLTLEDHFYNWHP